MGSSARLEPAYARRAQARAVADAATRGPLQSLTDRELQLEVNPLTVYPRPAQTKVRAWVRFGAEPVQVWAVILRSTPQAAGIEFRDEENTYRCWVWGSACTPDENALP